MKDQKLLKCYYSFSWTTIVVFSLIGIINILEHFRISGFVYGILCFLVLLMFLITIKEIVYKTIFDGDKLSVRLNYVVMFSTLLLWYYVLKDMF